MVGKVLLFLFLALQCFTFSEAKATLHNYGSCQNDQYQCRNGACIRRSYHCDGKYDCSDQSDEAYCSYMNIKRGCPVHYPFFRCSNGIKCIPKVWQCDGVIDCSDRSDEMNCLNEVERVAGSIAARQKAANWLKNQRRNATGNAKWGSRAPRTAIALYLADSNYFNGSNSTGNELAYEIDNQVLVGILKARTQQVSVNELALYIHALLVTCLNPRDFHGIDLVARLRLQVDKQENYTSPLVLLALCNAKDKMTPNDVSKLVHAFNLQERPFWTGTKALSLLALACINNLPDGPFVKSATINEMTMDLKKRQCSNGSFENIQTTALVMQALIAARKEKHGWKMDEAVSYLVKNQDDDGSYGNFLNTYFTVPVLHYKSLLNISSAHCKNKSNDGVVDVLDDLKDKLGNKIMVKYSLWFEDEVDLVRSLEIRVKENSTFFDIMNLAKSVDENYDFKYNLVDSKPYVYSLNDYEDDPENERFWFLYMTNSTGFVNELISLSPIDVVPKNKEEYIMWYRSGHWTEDMQAILDGATKEL